MNKIKLLLLAFGMAFTATAALCILTGNPLVYHPIDYGITGFSEFALLILLLSLGLVYINLPVLHWLKKISKLNLNPVVYYITMTLIVLQVVTMVTGFYESLITRGVEADAFYYYKCVTNSCLYILTGNLTAVTIAYLYGKEEQKNENSI